MGQPASVRYSLRLSDKQVSAKLTVIFFGKESGMRSSKVTERIYAKAFELLEQHPEGIHFTELRSKIEESDRTFHPKTVNGCVGKLT